MDAGRKDENMQEPSHIVKAAAAESHVIAVALKIIMAYAEIGYSGHYERRLVDGFDRPSGYDLVWIPEVTTFRQAKFALCPYENAFEEALRVQAMNANESLYRLQRRTRELYHGRTSVPELIDHLFEAVVLIEATHRLERALAIVRM